MNRKFYQRDGVEAILNARKDNKQTIYTFRGADLYGDLSGLDFSSVNLLRADLAGCDLRNTNLSDSNFNNALTLADVLGVVGFMGIGSRNDTLYVWRKNNDNGGHDYIFVTGCFEGTESEFRKAIRDKVKLLGEDYKPHAAIYRRVIPMLKRALDLQYQSED